MRCEIVRTTEKALLWWLQMYFCPAMGGFFACRPFLWNVPGARAFSCGRKQTVASLIRQLLYFSPAFPASKVVDFVHLILQAFCGILYIEAFCIQILHVAFFCWTEGEICLQWETMCFTVRTVFVQSRSTGCGTFSAVRGSITYFQL